MTAERRSTPATDRGQQPQRRHLVAVPSDAEVRSFERFLAQWLAEAAERRMRRSTAA